MFSMWALCSDVYKRQVYLCTDEKIGFEGFSPECFVQTDGGAVDQYDPKPMRLPQELFELNRKRELISAAGGTSIVGSCTPYLAGWLPMRGEHFVTTESSNVLFSNAVFGAMGNANGTAACAWAAITGRSPKWGNHIQENRYASIEFKVECPCETPQDWDIIGYTLGRLLKLNQIPVPVSYTHLPSAYRAGSLWGGALHGARLHSPARAADEKMCIRDRTMSPPETTKMSSFAEVSSKFPIWIENPRS